MSDIPSYIKELITDLYKTQEELTSKNLELTYIKIELETVKELINKLLALMELKRTQIFISKNKFSVEGSNICGYSVEEIIKVSPQLKGVQIKNYYIFDEPYGGKLMFEVQKEKIPFKMTFFGLI